MSELVQFAPRRRPTFAEKRKIILNRRERAALQAAGFEEIQGPWEIDRGYRFRERIVEVRIDPRGKSVWVKTAEADRWAVHYGIAGRTHEVSERLVALDLAARAQHGALPCEVWGIAPALADRDMHYEAWRGRGAGHWGGDHVGAGAILGG